MMNRFGRLAALAAGTALCLGTAARAEDSTDPIRMILNDWTGQLISAQIMGEALKREGFNVEYIQANEERWKGWFE